MIESLLVVFVDMLLNCFFVGSYILYERAMNFAGSEERKETSGAKEWKILAQKIKEIHKIWLPLGCEGQKKKGSCSKDAVSRLIMNWVGL